MSGIHHSEGSSSPSSPSSGSQNNSYFNYQAAINNNAPKFGTIVPNRVFVGGISPTTTEEELCQLFSQYGNVQEAKIVFDRGGASKGYGFITFDSEEEAKRLQKDSDNIIYKEKRLNIAPAVKKQVFTNPLDNIPSVSSLPVPSAPPSNMMYHNGMPVTYHNGMAFFPSNGQQLMPATPPTISSQEAVVYPQPTYAPPPSQSNQAAYGTPVMYANPAPMFMPTQQYQYSPMSFDSFYQVAPNTSYIYASPGPPSLVGSQGGSGPEAIQYQIYPQPPPSDMYYAAAPMYPTTMLVNYDPTFYPYSLESNASNNSVVEVSSSSNYAEDDKNSNVPSNVNQETETTQQLQHETPQPQQPLPPAQPQRPTETPVVSLLKLQETSHEEREINSRRNINNSNHNNNNSAPKKVNNNNNLHTGHHHHSTPESPALVYYPSNMYTTPNHSNTINPKYANPTQGGYPSQTPHHHHHHHQSINNYNTRPHNSNYRGMNYNPSYRHKTPPNSYNYNNNYIPRTPQIPNKFPRPLYYNNNNNVSNYDYNNRAKHTVETNNNHTSSNNNNTKHNNTPSLDSTARDSPKRSLSPPPPPYSPMIQPLFTTNPDIYSTSFSPPAQQIQQSTPLQSMVTYMPPPGPPPPVPRTYTVLSNNGAPRRMNPTTRNHNNNKTSVVS